MCDVAIQGNHVTWTLKACASKKKGMIIHCKKKFSSWHLLTWRRHCRVDLNRCAVGHMAAASQNVDAK